MIKTKKWPIILFMLMLMSQLAQSQSYDQIIKLRAEYEKLKEAQDLQSAMGQSTVPGEDGGPQGCCIGLKIYRNSIGSSFHN